MSRGLAAIFRTPVVTLVSLGTSDHPFCRHCNFWLCLLCCKQLYLEMSFLSSIYAKVLGTNSKKSEETSSDGGNGFAEAYDNEDGFVLYTPYQNKRCKVWNTICFHKLALERGEITRVTRSILGAKFLDFIGVK